MARISHIIISLKPVTFSELQSYLDLNSFLRLDVALLFLEDLENVFMKAKFRNSYSFSQWYIFIICYGRCGVFKVFFKLYFLNLIAISFM